MTGTLAGAGKIVAGDVFQGQVIIDDIILISTFVHLKGASLNNYYTLSFRINLNYARVLYKSLLCGDFTMFNQP